MTANCLAPGFVKLFYTSNGHPHVQTFGISPQNSTGSILNTRGGTTQAFDAALDAYVALAKALFKTTAHFDGAELYTQADCASAPIFRFAYDLGGPIAGTLTNADQPYQQLTLSYRTQDGGKFKLQFMESVVENTNVKNPITGYGAGIAALNTYLLGSSSVVFARDNSFAAFPLWAVTKVNDKLRKKYLNP